MDLGIGNNCRLSTAGDPRKGYFEDPGTQAPHDVPEIRASGALPMRGLSIGLEVTWVRPYHGLILSGPVLSSTACLRLDRTRGLVVTL